MLSPRSVRAKAAIKKSLPLLGTAYRGIRHMTGMRAVWSRRNVNSYVREQTGSRVVSGPFSGMRLIEEASWGDGDVAPKLLGTYEQELHETIERFRGRSYGAVVDVGCAEGYYAVGFSMLFPDLTVYAFDTNLVALRVARRAAEANGVEGRLVFGDFCDRATLLRLAERHNRLLIISDCEGYEEDLFCSDTRQQLGSSDLIIECHDKIRPNITHAMTSALSLTHIVQRLDAIGRNPNQFPFMTELHEFDRWQAVCENRPYCSHWLACDSRSALPRSA